MTVARLEELPRLGKTTDEGGVYLIVEPEYLYRVFYRLDRDEVFVIRILAPTTGLETQILDARTGNQPRARCVSTQTTSTGDP
jgi:plasmid stabilization system protein ParE